MQMQTTIINTQNNALWCFLHNKVYIIPQNSASACRPLDQVNCRPQVVIYDLLCVKSHQAELSVLGAADINLITESFLCVS